MPQSPADAFREALQRQATAREVAQQTARDIADRLQAERDARTTKDGAQ